MMMIIMIIVSYTYMWGCKTKNWVLPWNKGVSPGHNDFTPRKKNMILYEQMRFTNENMLYNSTNKISGGKH